MRRTTQWLAGVAGVLALAGAAQAQQRLGSSSSGGITGSSSGGFTGGSSSGGFTGGSSSGGFTGGSGSGGFTGGSGSTGGISGGRGGVTGGTTSYGTTAVYGSTFANPLSAGYGPNVSSGTGSTSGFGYSAMSKSGTGTYLSTFGQPLGGQATLSRTGQQLGGSAGLGGGLGTAGRGMGASSMGTRRAPQYMATVAGSTLDRQRAAAEQARAEEPTYFVPEYPTQPSTVDVQTAVTRKLPARDNVTVSTNDEGTVILRGQVGSERERRLAAALAYTVHGTSQVRNELTVKRGR